METRVCRLHAPHDLRIETDIVAPPAEGEALVAIGAGGICGSDLHYFHHGGFGPVRVKEPIILGHEVAGVVDAVGPGVTGLAPGDRVALNPSRPCGACRYCAADLPNHCLEMRFYGSAMRFPHEQGGFRELINAPAAQCVKLTRASVAEGACAEPLAVCLHAAAQAGDLSGASVLVTGAGPIGVLCVAVAKLRGAAEIVATDIEDAALAMARRMGATETVNVGTEAARMEAFSADKGRFDVVFECSAAPSAIAAALAAARPRAVMVQVGVGGEIPVPINLLVAKEIQFRGTHRFHPEFAEAAALIDKGAIDVKPIITGTWPLDQAAEAFAAASDRSRSTKAQLSFAR
ncbi:MAG: L-idonate 5-dehydrogenase [Pikeienuella sp.]